MENGICPTALAPIRGEPSHKAEMTSQLLFGEMFKIEEEQKDWLLIRTEWDEYVGWVNKPQVLMMDAVLFKIFLRARHHITTDTVTELTHPDNHLLLSAGSSLFVLRDKEIEPGFVVFVKPDTLHTDNLSGRKMITGNALKFLNCPYVWGGRSIFGIDCSGLVQVIYKMSGIRLPRDSSDQVSSGESVSLISEALPGDVAFFDDNEGNITHTGIILEGQRIIHASGRVRIDMIDHHGIYNEGLQKYTHPLRTIRRVVNLG
jgi:hypothetical protein